MSPKDKADRAQRILDDEVFQSMQEELRMDLVARLESVPMGDIDTQHEIALSLQLLRQMKTRLMSYANEAAMEKAVARHDSFVAKMRESYRLLRPGAAKSG